MELPIILLNILQQKVQLEEVYYKKACRKISTCQKNLNLPSLKLSCQSLQIWQLDVFTSILLLWLMSLQMILFHHYFKNFKKSSQKIFLMGDFNNDSMTYENFEQVNSFVDSLASNFLSCKYFYPHECKLLLH